MKRVLVATALLSFSALSFAQEPVTPPAPSPTPAVAVVAPQGKPDMVDATLGLAWGGPARLTGSATLMWGQPKMLVAFSPGKLIQVRAGSRGGQVGLGLVFGVFEDSLVKPSGLAVTMKAIALRSWRDPSGLTNGHTYVGGETDIVLLGIRTSLGYARKVGGTGGPDGKLVWSVGLGL